MHTQDSDGLGSYLLITFLAAIVAGAGHELVAMVKNKLHPEEEDVEEEEQSDSPAVLVLGNQNNTSKRGWEFGIFIRRS